MRLARGSSVALAGVLVGLGVAMFAKAVYQVGFSELTVEHMLGPGLVLVGLLRIRMQRMIDAGYKRSGGTPPEEGGDDGDTT